MPKQTLSAPTLAFLPENLQQRCFELNGRPVRPEGHFVLYWMHHAVRAHENPALDTAILLANRLRVPVLVYQGLGGNHPYGNDRHNCFILEGARDLANDLGQRGVRQIFHLPQEAAEKSPLDELASRACLVITEDYPAPPMGRWIGNFARRSPVFTLAVDAACLVPMRSQPKSFARAFEFRRQNQNHLIDALQQTWAEPTAEYQEHLELGCVNGIDLHAVDLLETAGKLPVDHGVPPVADTPGGSAAGYRRWDAFKAHGLADYAALRNDAAVEWPRGTSRLSPYLHHGHVSPFRIAREAAALGAHKFIDELFVWRELAFNFCLHAQNPERVEQLPRWAQETLAEHLHDRRQVIDEEALARSLSGDLLWDAAQTSLRHHGELHNNLRMTWAKSIPHWRPDAQSALQTLVELNHRYALDGSDPSSYGGLLWALGLFDRPFPETAVLGRVRQRSTRQHLQRLDFARYRERVKRPSVNAPRRVVVIGAGVSGLMAARTLSDQGHEVTVFEKSRGMGGRAATRRTASARVDHGAQYFTIKSPILRPWVSAWVERGLVSKWSPTVADLDQGEGLPAPVQHGQWYLASPGMSALGRHLADGLTIHTRTRITRLVSCGGQWELVDDSGDTRGSYDAVVVAVPAPQAVPLLAEVAPDVAQQLGEVRYLSTWTAILRLVSNANLPFHVIRAEQGHPVLAWMAGNAGKPGRDKNHCLVHAQHAWSKQHLEDTPAEVADRLGRAFCEITGLPASSVVSCQAHRWLYAEVHNPVGRDYLHDGSLVACGDWCTGSRLENAMLSGQAAAGHLLRRWTKEYRRALFNSDAAANMEERSCA